MMVAPMERGRLGYYCAWCSQTRFVPLAQADWQLVYSGVYREGLGSNPRLICQYSSTTTSISVISRSTSRCQQLTLVIHSHRVLHRPRGGVEHDVSVYTVLSGKST